MNTILGMIRWTNNRTCNFENVCRREFLIKYLLIYNTFSKANISNSLVTKTHLRTCRLRFLRFQIRRLWILRPFFKLWASNYVIFINIKPWKLSLKFVLFDCIWYFIIQDPGSIFRSRSKYGSKQSVYFRYLYQGVSLLFTFKK